MAAKRERAMKTILDPLDARLIKAEAEYNDISVSKTISYIIKKHFSAMSDKQRADLLKIVE